MNNLSQLNTQSSLEFEFQDARPSGVVYDRDPILFSLDQEIDIASDGTDTVIQLQEPINIVEFVNYDTANTVLEYEIQVTENTTDVDWPVTLPSYMTVNKTATTFTVTGFRRSEDWDLVANQAQWTLPTNYETQQFYLVGRIRYFNSETNQTETLEWQVFDFEFYYLAALETESTVSATATANFTFDFDFSLETSLVATSGKTLGVTEFTATSNLNCVFQVGQFRDATAALEIAGNVSAVGNINATADVDLAITAEITCDLTEAPFTAFISRDTAVYLKGNNLKVLYEDGSTAVQFVNEATDYTLTNTISADNGFIQIEGTPASNGEFGIAFNGRGVGFAAEDSLTEIKTFGNKLIDFQTFDQTDFITVPRAIPASFEVFLIENSTSFNDPAVSDWQGFVPNQLFYAFAGCSTFNQNLSNWDTSRINNWQGCFKDAAAFNGDITNWITSGINNTNNNEQTMQEMFSGAANFNQDISNWDVSSIVDMQDMFREAVNFNQDISSWDVSSVENMDNMFLNADTFNQPIGVWDTTAVLSMAQMFANVDSAGTFNQDLSGWCVEFIPSQPNNFDLGQPNWTQPKPFWGGICGTVFRTRDVDSVLSSTESLFGSGSLVDGTLQMSAQVLNYQQDPFTIEFWSKGDSNFRPSIIAQNTDRGNSFVASANAGVALFNYAYEDYNSGLIESDREVFTSDDNSSDSTSWKHYAFVVDFSNEFVKIFIDGILIDNHTVVKGAESGDPNDFTTDSLYPADDLTEITVRDNTGTAVDNIRISNGTRYAANFTPGELTTDSNTTVLLNFDGNIDNEA